MKHDPIPDRVDLSKGDTQCMAGVGNGEDGYYCCSRKNGHEGVHIGSYGYEMRRKDVSWQCVECSEVAPCEHGNKAMKLVYDLAAMSPTDEDDWGEFCSLCGVTSPYHSSKKLDLSLPESHAPMCLWRRAIELKGRP